jgi:hypothetical protein
VAAHRQRAGTGVEGDAGEIDSLSPPAGER